MGCLRVKAPEGSEGDWTKAELLPEGRSADGAALSQRPSYIVNAFHMRLLQGKRI